MREKGRERRIDRHKEKREEKRRKQEDKMPLEASANRLKTKFIFYITQGRGDEMGWEGMGWDGVVSGLSGVCQQHV